VPFRQTFAQLFAQDVAIAWVVFGLVVATLIAAMLLSWHRRRTAKGPSRKATATRIEVTYLAALTGVAVFLVVASLTANAKESTDPFLVFASFSANAQDFPRTSVKPALRVQVTAFQWCWRFHYTQAPVTVTARCQGGAIPTLVLPTGRPVELDVTSTDVIHAFWVPYLRYKLYAYPGHVNKFTVTLTKDGRWMGRCAQLCGLFHYEMDFWLRAVPPSQFQHWLRAHQGVTTGSGA
jgi:heme/copper-type cytochrome/quinol oxidase subunit 2